MPIPVDLQPPPQFERSLSTYVTINFERIRRALLSAVGGNYQTGSYTKAFVGFATGIFNINFGRSFGTVNPMVLIMPTYTGGTNFIGYVMYSQPSYFSMRADTANGAAAANDMTLQWFAFIP